MKDLATIRFLSSNYLFLQGLRLIPVGLVSLVLAAWANSDRRGAQDNDFLIGCYVFAIVGYYLVGRYYQRVYGVVRITFRQAVIDLGILAAATLLAGLTFWVDDHIPLPFSTFGIFLGLGLIADYVRMTWQVRGRYLKIQPIFGGVILALSLLPWAGLGEWWTLLGMRSAHLALLLIVSLVMLIEGWASHRLLVRLLGPA
jgi:hypothetical protein